MRLKIFARKSSSKNGYLHKEHLKNDREAISRGLERIESHHGLDPDRIFWIRGLRN
jgi:hypothetical protein